MASPKFISFCFLVLFVSSYGITCCLSDIRHPKEHAAALFVFGDSLFDVGNNNYSNTTADNQANYSPYGKTETFLNHSSGRFSDDRVNIPDFIGKYAKLPLSPPYLFPGFQGYVHGVIFASAGAGPLVETHQGVGIHKTGGRKFGVLNQSVLGCIPLVKALVNGSEGLKEGGVTCCGSDPLM
ncbi:GDSL esterase/lipase 5 [Glycine soja]